MAGMGPVELEQLLRRLHADILNGETAAHDGAHDGAHGGAHGGAHDGAHDGGGASAPLMRRLGAHEDAPSWLLHCPTDGKLRPHFVLRDPALALKAEVKGSRFLIRFTYALMTSDCDCDQSPPMAPSTAL